METNSSNPMASPVQYPTIEVPGKGTYVVKFGAGAVFVLEKSGWTIPRIAASMKDLSERKGMPVLTLLTILAACIHNQTKMDAEELAWCFGWPLPPEIGQAVAKAFVLAFPKAATAEPAQAPAVDLTAPNPIQ